MLLECHGGFKEEVKVVGMKERVVIFGKSFLRILGTGSLCVHSILESIYWHHTPLEA